LVPHRAGHVSLKHGEENVTIEDCPEEDVVEIHAEEDPNEQIESEVGKLKRECKQLEDAQIASLVNRKRILQLENSKWDEKFTRCRNLGTQSQPRPHPLALPKADRPLAQNASMYLKTRR
jgi:regulator of replication initiation timing